MRLCMNAQVYVCVCKYNILKWIKVDRVFLELSLTPGDSADVLADKNTKLFF